MSRVFGPSDQLLDCYRRGVFPMGGCAATIRGCSLSIRTCGACCRWIRFHLSKSLAQARSGQGRFRDPHRYTVSLSVVMELCAEVGAGQAQHLDQLPHPQPLFSALHRQGPRAFSVECVAGWRAGRRSIWREACKAAFFGESMFSRATDASKVALAHLVARLKSWRVLAARHAVRDRATWKQFGARGNAAGAIPPAAGAGAGSRCGFLSCWVLGQAYGMFGKGVADAIGRRARRRCIRQHLRCSGRALDHPDVVGRMLERR